jgi:hypothetical protein
MKAQLLILLLGSTLCCSFPVHIGIGLTASTATSREYRRCFQWTLGYSTNLSSHPQTLLAAAAIDPTTDVVSLTSSLETVGTLTKIAILDAGTEAGLAALRNLATLCERRKRFDFDKHTNKKKNEHQIISHIPQLLPALTRNQFLQVVRYMESNEWLSRNPDSVDGLPSLHLNLVCNGEPLFPTNDSDTAVDDFQSGIQQLYRIIHPHIYNKLLPKVKHLLQDTSTGSSSLRISDVFLRRYGQDICGGDRNGISAHYDVFSRVTAVVALDDVAASGRNGLFTTAIDTTTGQTSNHKALRRFFSLQAGDAAIHSWDVLHGVDVEPGLDRTSLIVWFDEYSESVKFPWLVNHRDYRRDSTNDVLHFVFASALSNVNLDKSEMNDPIHLYLRSASQRNTFALTRMGSLCEEDALNKKR